MNETSIGQRGAEKGPPVGAKHSSASSVRTWNRVIIAATLVNATFETMLVPALPLIRADLHLTPSAVSWAYSAYMLAAAMSLPIVGKLGDLYGPRRMLAFVILVVSAGVLVPAIGHSVFLLIVGQALQGLGVTLLPLGIAQLTQGREDLQDIRSAGLVAAAAASTAIGAVLAGIFLRFTGYRVLYWGAFVLDLGILASLLVMLRREPPHHRREGSGVVDWLAALLLGGALVSLLVMVTIIGVSGWVSLTVAGLFALSLVLGTLGIWRSRRSTEPLIDLRLLRLRSVNRVAIVQLLSGFGAFGTYVLAPLIIQSPAAVGGLGRDASTTGFALAPFGISAIIAPLLVVFLRRRFGAAMVMLGGSLFAIAGPALMIVGKDVIVLSAAMAALGFGIGLMLTQSFDFVGTVVPAHQVASLSSLIYVLKMVGSAFGAQASTSLVGVAPSNHGFVTALTLALVALGASTLAAVSLLGQKRGENLEPTHQ